MGKKPQVEVTQGSRLWLKPSNSRTTHKCYDDWPGTWNPTVLDNDLGVESGFVESPFRRSFVREELTVIIRHRASPEFIGSRNCVPIAFTGTGEYYFPCSADHEQDWQPYPVDPYSAICDDHTYCRESAGTGLVVLKVVPNECCLGRSPWIKQYAAPFPTPTIGMKYEVGMYVLCTVSSSSHPSVRNCMTQ